MQAAEVPMAVPMSWRNLGGGRLAALIFQERGRADHCDGSFLVSGTVCGLNLVRDQG